MARQYTGHVMQPNHSNALPRHIVAVKTEVIPQPIPDRPTKTHNRFRLGVCVSSRYQRDKCGSKVETPFASPQRFWDRLYGITKATQTTWLIGHNVLFDLRHLDFTQELTEGRMALDSPRKVRKQVHPVGEDVHNGGCACIKQPPTIIGFRVAATQGRIVVVDLMNWFNENLDELSKQADWQIRSEPLPNDSVLEWYDHATQPANAILDTFVELMQWTKDNELGMFRYTSAAQSMAAYRHRFMPTKIYVHDNIPCKKHERHGYYGGRTECFYIGKIDFDVWQYDVQSMYPSVMRSEPVPVKLLDFTPSERYLPPTGNEVWKNMIAAVTLHTDDAVYPVRRNGYCVYPTGVFQTVLAGPELLRAYRRGHIIAVASQARYETAVIFTEFVDTLWAMRQQYKQAGNVLYDSFAKKILNSLYGKWGQQSEEWVRRPDIEAPGPWAAWVQYCMGRVGKRTFRSFGWSTEELIGKGETIASFPAISAFITSAARCKMNWLRYTACPENVLYQGSDALIVTLDGKHWLEASGEIQDNAIGKLRLEYRADRGHIYACHDYLLGDKQVIAGRAGKYVTRAYSEYLQRKSTAINGLFSGNPHGETIVESVSWRRQAEYVKGIVGPTGYVEPLVLDEGNGPISAVASDSSTIN